jgi:tRNA modification GTPase
MIELSKTTIVAPATGSGISAVALIRLSGPEAFSIAESVFVSPLKKRISEQKGYRILFGKIVDDERMLDEVLVSIFRAPHSYTGEDVIEISCHGSPYVRQEILALLYRHGAVAASPGEFTLRAFLNGKMDLSQAEAVADLIASENQSSHELAMKQLRGAYSTRIKELRNSLMNFMALIELELDFSTEDVEFADRNHLRMLVSQINQVIEGLLQSFALGNAIKTGIPVTIVGKPNAGKSTLLNALVREERAIVSDIEGTTRDSIEDTLIIEGYSFRLIDTAGLRQTADIVENLGIERSYAKIREADIVLYLFDASVMEVTELTQELEKLNKQIHAESIVFAVGNKCDLSAAAGYEQKYAQVPYFIPVSARDGKGIQRLEEALVEHVKNRRQSDTLVTNARHAEALRKALQSLQSVLRGLDLHIPGDLLAADIRDALSALSEITGEVSNDEVLGVIFGKFCIGK